MEKLLEDKEILAQVLSALQLRANAFSSRLKDLSRHTIYKILTGNASMTMGTIKKITNAYSEVNPEFLEYGIEPVLLSKKPKADEQLEDILSVPARLHRIEENQKRIEAKLDQLLNQTTN